MLALRRVLEQAVGRREDVPSAGAENPESFLEVGRQERAGKVRDYVEEYTMADGRRLYLLAEGRLVNLAAAEGHPSAVMDMSFANQALGVEYLIQNQGKLEPGIYNVPTETDQEVGRLKLQSLGINIDTLTADQQRYQDSWEEGT